MFRRFEDKQKALDEESERAEAKALVAAEAIASALSPERCEYVAKTVFAWLSGLNDHLPEDVSEEFYALGIIGRLGFSFGDCDEGNERNGFDECCGVYVGAIALRPQGPVPQHVRNWLGFFEHDVLRRCCGRVMVPPFRHPGGLVDRAEAETRN